jgi:hypothetical protein
MKTKMNTFKKLLVLIVMILPFGAFAQLNFTENYSSTTGWTFNPASGSGLSISSSNLNYTNVTGASIKRVSKSLGTTLSLAQTWRMEFTFEPTAVGTWGPGHFLAALTAGTQDPYYSSFTNGTTFTHSVQDAIAVTWISNNASSTTSTFELRVSAKESNLVSNVPANNINGSNWVSSSPIILTSPFANAHRIILDRINQSQFVMTVLNATTGTVEGTTCLWLPSNYSISGLTTLQHGVYAQSAIYRSLTAKIRTMSVKALTFNAGTIGNNQNVCSGTPAALVSLTAATINSIALTTGAGYSYQWQYQASGSTIWQDITGATSATYTPPAVSMNNKYRRVLIATCLNAPLAYSNIVTVKVSTAITATAQLIQNAKCECNGQAQINVTGGLSPYTYTWSHDASFHASSSATLCTGDYQITVTDANGCTSVTNLTVGFYDPGAITSVGITTTNSSCGTNGSATLTVVQTQNPPYTYSWDNSTYSSTNPITGLVTGYHNVTVLDAHGCKYSTYFYIKNDVVTLTPTIIAPTCTGNNASITISGSATGTYSYAWTGPSFTGTFTTTNATVSNLTPGTYNVTATVTTAGGSVCSATAQVIVPAYVFDATVINTNANVPVCDATATINIISGTAPIGCTWYKQNIYGNYMSINTSSAMSLSGLCAGNYYINIADACKNTITRYFVIGNSGISPLKSVDESEATEATITAYPNPAKDELNIKLEDADEAVVKISLFDIMGKEVMTVKDGAMSSDVVTVNTSDLTNGIYFLKGMINENIIMQKVIIAR